MLRAMHTWRDWGDAIYYIALVTTFTRWPIGRRGPAVEPMFPRRSR